MTNRKQYIFLFLLIATLGFAQQPVQTSVDSTKIKIGSQFNLTLKVKGTKETRVAFPESKNLGQLEVLESYPIDTIKKDATFEFIKKYGLTQFDSGRYVIPRIPVLIGNKQFLSDSAVIVVNNVVVDTLKQKMHDIKPIVEVKDSSSDFWWYLLGIVLLGGLGFLGYWLYKKYKNRPKEEVIVYASPIEKATSLLQNLEKKSLLEHGDVKSYYSEMTDITRTYIEETVHIPAMESTTDELLVAMKQAAMKKKMGIRQETMETFEKILKNADLVKFAKSKPMDFEITDDRKNIEKIIFTIDKALPKEIEEDEVDSDYERQQEELKRKKIKKRNTMVGVASGCIALLVIGFVFLNGTSLFGSSTKELYDQDWITSEYGNPGVIIATPNVLIRKDADKELPKGTMALLKEMQMFEYGGYFDDYYITVSTSKFKQPMKDSENAAMLDKALEGGLKALELRGAQDIIVKTEDFNTGNGFSGRKAYGTMNMLDPIKRKSEKVYYEYIAFGQEGGLQQVLLAHKEGDEFGSKITSRILESVELRKAAQ
ncbi:MULTISPECIES: BatD family protein [Flavobacterium]|uniref:BatD family protein n=1 Tax=Flavobacterium TaxID=237 RepID=UPI001FCBEA6A|nr:MULTISPECIES: BatD family protein [Flavobacterium]UOK43069.1 BatD family protein [Flavobacterium enshiense]